jgi:hypothetical protein
MKIMTSTMPTAGRREAAEAIGADVVAEARRKGVAAVFGVDVVARGERGKERAKAAPGKGADTRTANDQHGKAAAASGLPYFVMAARRVAAVEAARDRVAVAHGGRLAVRQRGRLGCEGRCNVRSRRAREHCHARPYPTEGDRRAARAARVAARGLSACRSGRVRREPGRLVDLVDRTGQVERRAVGTPSGWASRRRRPRGAASASRAG